MKYHFFIAYAHLLTFSIINSKPLSVEIENRLSAHSLNRFHHSRYSQNSEDAIVDEIFKRLRIEQGFFVEFGAGDGIYLSNTLRLWENGWEGVMIEANNYLFSLLKQRYVNSQTVLCLNEFVAFNKEDRQNKTFDQIADQYFATREIDFLSIDIDGADYLILEGLERKPKVICIEIGMHWHPLLKIRIPDEYAIRDRQQPIWVMCDIAEKKGYKPICFEGGNLFLIRNDLHYFFNDVTDDIVTLWQDGWRSSPISHSYILNMQYSDEVVRKFSGDLNNFYPLSIYS